MKAQILLVSLITLSLNACINQPSCFQNKLFNFNFPAEGFYKVKVQQNPSSYNVKAYGDFNGDLWSDFIASIGNNQVALFLWDKNTDFFVKQDSMNITGQCDPEYIYLYDLDKDGLLDFTVSGSNTNENHCLIPFLQIPNTQPPKFIEMKGTQLSTPLAPTYFSHKKLEGNGFIVYNTSRMLLRYSMTNQIYNPTEWKTLFNSQPDSYNNIPFSNMHWNSFLDITGDCLTDVVITNANKQIEFWIDKGYTFELGQILNVTNLASLSFSDINYDGGVDVVLAYSNGTIGFYQNTRPATKKEDFCCKQCITLPFNFEKPITFSFGDNLLITDQVIHFGDMDIDGYPDILIQLLNTETNQKLPYIYTNKGANTFQFAPSNQYNQLFSSTLKGTTIESISFFDILENGIIDIFVAVQNSDNSYSLVAFYNNYLYQNSFFLKGYGAIGPSVEQGSMLTGAVFYWINSVDGVVKVSTQSQCIQTAYNALQLPFVLSGLGRANNYVESFTIANEGVKKQWSPIIPNSQLAVFTMQTNPNDWAITIFVLPTESLVYVVIVTGIILVVLGTVLIFIKYRNYKNRPKIYDLMIS